MPCTTPTQGAASLAALPSWHGFCCAEGGKGGWFCHTPAVPVARSADAYAIALEVMASASQLAGAKEGMAAFLDKRQPAWPD